jgi:Uma2 family endonuclease
MATVVQKHPAATENGVPTLFRVSVEQYHRMIEAGVFTTDDRLELLEGLLVAKMPQNTPHVATIGRLQRRLGRLLPDDWLLEVQGPIVCRDSEPEPDFAILEGPEEKYDTRKPAARDVRLLIEVSDTSLGQDQGLKLQLYARHRIPVYWIVNLVDRRIEVYTEPRGGRSPGYRNRHDYTPGDSSPVVLDGETIGSLAVRDILPRGA